jgi:hypothetical protein
MRGGRRELISHRHTQTATDIFLPQSTQSFLSACEACVYPQSNGKGLHRFFYILNIMSILSKKFSPQTHADRNREYILVSHHRERRDRLFPLCRWEAGKGEPLSSFAAYSSWCPQGWMVFICRPLSGKWKRTSATSAPWAKPRWRDLRDASTSGELFFVLLCLVAKLLKKRLAK